jgi:hypothetical protein
MNGLLSQSDTATFPLVHRSLSPFGTSLDLDRLCPLEDLLLDFSERNGTQAIRRFRGGSFSNIYHVAGHYGEANIVYFCGRDARLTGPMIRLHQVSWVHGTRWVALRRYVNSLSVFSAS